MTSPASGSEARRSSGFDRLARPIQRWIWDQGWKGLRPIQEAAITALIDAPKDAIIAAGTAGGKTEAAFLPLISRLLDPDREEGPGFDLLYVGPLRALINDQFSRLEDLCAKTDLPVHPWHGDISSGVKAHARKTPRGILLITPESLEALFVLRGLEIPGLFGRLDAVVIDELHALLDTERGVHLRSLLTRIELATGRRIPRIGLSATLGDMGLARGYLRPDAPEAVSMVQVEGEDGAELRLQIRGYVAGGDPPKRMPDPRAKEDPYEAAKEEIASHIFDNLRGRQNLVFAGARGQVEDYSDRLRRRCEEQALPNEFLPHHANLSREHRTDLERRLKAGRLPTTAVCTSTLELGVDIGHVDCVAQIGAPYSVASLRQRLGRSGRRAGRPAVLRLYVIEQKDSPDAAIADRLRFSLLRTVASVDLLLSKWCEPPRPQALHLSTLVHQILSVIAQRGGAHANRLYATLCRQGPFSGVSPELFGAVLRSLGDPETALIEQSPDGTLLLGREGERQVESHRFYAVFKTPEEFRLLHKGRPLGPLPIDSILLPGVTIIFAGRRWKVEAVHERERVVEVSPDPTGRPPVFGGEVGSVHDRIVQRMREILEGDEIPIYLDAIAADLLAEARKAYFQLDLARNRILPDGSGARTLLTWRGGEATETLALALLQALDDPEVMVEPRDGVLTVMKLGDASQRIEDALRRIAEAPPPDPVELAALSLNLEREKMHPFLSRDLLAADLASSRLRTAIVPELAREILG